VSPEAARNPFGHIDLRVPSMAEALPFYEALLPALGFTQRYDGPEWNVFATTAPPPSTAYFGITESAGHAVNENRIAFWAADPGEVDRLAEVVAAAGARDVSGPKPMAYGPGYYAVYFADPGGNRFEVYHRPPV
jgi:catechol 2,3-dioxygenase-like lactoylglutathione lyase family enzyme